MGSLVSVNVGLPHDVEWQGKVVRTAVWKRPIVGRVMACRLNIDGDGQGDLNGHGGEYRAVMVYQLASYRHWEEFLGRSDFEYGQFGENLTVEGLADDEVCIGDRYQIGGALFEVTQPRVTCYRVGLRMNNPNMPALLVSHRRPGFYFRVIREGEIGAGDAITKVADGPERVSVAEVDGLLYLPGHAREQVERALRVPALSPGWKGSLEALAAADAAGKPLGNAGLAPSASAPPAWSGLRPLRVAAVQEESVGVRSFILASEDGSALPAPLAGQYLVLKLQVREDSAPILRSYSMSGPQHAGTYRISVKRDEGVGSQYMHDHVSAGERLQVSAPRGTFTLAAGDTPVVLLSAGIGATPVLAMLHSLVGSNSGREIWWLYGARNRKEHPFSAEVKTLLSRLAHSRSFVAYSRPAIEDIPGQDYDAQGRLDLTTVQRLDIPRSSEFYLCGPSGFLSELTCGLKAWGVPSGSIHEETFGSNSAITPGIAATSSRQPHPPTGEGGQGPTVSFARSGLSIPWSDRYQSLLEFAEACDVPVRWSCRVGVCHTCESGLIGGTVRYSPDPLDQPAQGNVLICCSAPTSEIQLDL